MKLIRSFLRYLNRHGDEKRGINRAPQMLSGFNSTAKVGNHGQISSYASVRIRSIENDGQGEIHNSIGVTVIGDSLKEHDWGMHRINDEHSWIYLGRQLAGHDYSSLCNGQQSVAPQFLDWLTAGHRRGKI